MKCIYLSSILLLEVACFIFFINGEQQVPCYFIFGDSLVDNGNNNELATAAKVEFFPYGIDFPDNATGRFCNGRTTADIIAELLGFDTLIPSFQTATGTDILKGVNYASGSAGIRYETGKFMGENICLNKQVQHHQVTISRIVDVLGSKDLAMKHLNKCLYSIVIGNNDYINNYFTHYYNTSSMYTTEQFAQVLVQEYLQQIMTLYNSGARKVALTGVGPIGCMPYSVSVYGTSGSLCVDFLNNAVNLFNERLKSLADQLNNDLPDAKFIYLNTYGIVSEYFSFPDPGIQITGCCKVDKNGLCIPNEAPCENRNLHLFYDDIHPSEIINKIAAGISYLDLKKIL